MWFDRSVNEVYEKAIEPAVRQAGYKPLRIDRVDHTDGIDDEIIGRIQDSRFLVGPSGYGGFCAA